MNRTDPSGYRSLGDIFKQAFFLGPHILSDPMYWASPKTFNQYYGQASGVAIGIVAAIYSWNPAVAGAAAGSYSAFATSLLNGGSIGDAFRAGLVGGATGYVTGYLTAGIGDYYGHSVGSWDTELERALTHGVVGGAVSEIEGGSFSSGFYGSVVGSLAGSFSMAKFGSVPGWTGVSCYQPFCRRRFCRFGVAGTFGV
jgi:hypothetical protein